jgi:alkylation response protein AidB-like acyl-CoA dehydrogenase
VFVPDGYHWSAGSVKGPSPVDTTGIFAQFDTGALLLGIGLGAMDALTSYLAQRATFPGIFEDTSTRYQIGLHATRLNAAEAALESAMRKALAFKKNPRPEDRAAVSIAAMQGKIAALEATIGFTAEMHKFLGGQSTSNKYDYDRFWRDARTFALTDVIDVKVQQVGGWAMRRDAPPITFTS